MEPLFDESASRYDPLVDDTQIDGTQLDEAALLQVPVAWREQAWRNAELLVSAPTPAARALIEAQIEQTAAMEANLIIVATAYTPLSVQQALADLALLPADPQRVLQAVADRTANLARRARHALHSGRRNQGQLLRVARLRRWRRLPRLHHPARARRG